jgi:hypothetical protein
MIMNVLVRADDVPAASRAEYFYEAVRAAFGPLNMRAGDGQELPDQVCATELGAIRVAELSASKPGGADRTRRHIQSMDSDICKVDVVAQGEVVINKLAARPTSVPATTRSLTSPVPRTGPTRGPQESCRLPSCPS